MRDLTDAPEEQVAAEHARVATEGWGAQLLAHQSVDGFWGVGTPNPEWISLQTLLLLRKMGLDPTSEQAGRAVDRVRDNVRWRGVLPQDAPGMASRCLPAKSSRASTEGPWRSARTLGRTCRASSSDSWASR